MELAETYDLPFAVLINSDLYGLLSGTGRWVQRAGDEIVAHGRSNSERQIDMTPLEGVGVYRGEGDMAVYGYARVSTDGQSLSAQLAGLKAAQCENIFQEKISGARSDRKQLARLTAVLAKGTCLSSPDWIVWRGRRAIC
jgi:hypothetical protein